MKHETFTAEYWRGQSSKEINQFIITIANWYNPPEYLKTKALTANLVLQERKMKNG